MSLQWNFVAGFLYFEMGIVLLMLLPFISPQRWKKIAHSRLLGQISQNSAVVFYALMLVLSLLLIDAAREVSKYENPVDAAPDMKNNPQAEMMFHMKLFRAQRNLYISGFSLFLWLVIRRLVTLLVNNATLDASYKAAMSQASSASRMASDLLENSDNTRDQSDNSEEIKKLKRELQAAREETSKAEADVAAMKQQAESVSAEYDRLMLEHGKLQAELGAGDKKDD